MVDKSGYTILGVSSETNSSSLCLLSLACGEAQWLMSIIGR